MPHLKWRRMPQLSSEKWSIHYASLSAMFNPLHSISNQELFKKYLWYQNSHYDKYGQFPLWRGSHHMLSPNRHFSLSAKMNGTQRRTLVSPWRMHRTYCGMPKGTCRAEATSNSEKIKPVALAIIELRLSEGISQLLTYSVSRKIPLNKLFLKFCSDLLKAFWVDAKACLGLVSPNHYCLIVVRGNWGCFLGDIILWATPTPLWSLL